MLNSSNRLPTDLLVGLQCSSVGVNVAASIQQALQASCNYILDQLKRAGVPNNVIAGEMGWEASVMSQLKRGRYQPSLKTLQKLLDVLNKHAPTGVEFGPKDLFRDPVDIIIEEGRKQGVELVVKRRE